MTSRPTGDIFIIPGLYSSRMVQRVGVLNNSQLVHWMCVLQYEIRFLSGLGES